MWEKILKYARKYYEVWTYLVFGGLTTVINIGVYAGLSRAGLSTGVANAVAWAVAVLTAYVTNRRWVFRSRSAGWAALKEFLSFIACRVGTGVMDEVLMIVGVDVLGPTLVAPDRMGLWGLGMKVFVNILVIILNYIFSKLIIFRKGKDGEKS